MWRQRIDLRNTGHRCHKGRADRTSGTDQIAVLVAFPHQLLRDDIHDRVAVGNDGVQLSLQPCLHDLGKLRPVQLMSPAIADLPQRLVGIRNDRRILARPDRADLLDHVTDPAGVVDDDLPGFFLTQIGKFSQHLLCGPKVQRRLVIGIRKLLSLHDDPTVDLILRIHEMHIAGRDDGLVELLAKLYDPAVEIADILHIGYGVLFVIADQEFIVAQGLDLQVIIELYDPGDLGIRRTAEQCLVELSRHAGRANDQALPVLFQKALWQLRLPVKVIQM